MGIPDKFRQGIDWLQRGHFLYVLLIALGGGTVVRAILATLTSIPHIWITPIWLTCAGLLLWLLSTFGKKVKLKQELQGASPGSQLASRSPLPPVEGFSLDKFFADSYDSPLAADVSSVFSNSIAFYDGQSAREKALLKFIGVGAVLYGYDMIWAYVYKSQIMLLKKLNGGPIESEEARGFYGDAADAYPTCTGFTALRTGWNGFGHNHSYLRKEQESRLPYGEETS